MLCSCQDSVVTLRDTVWSEKYGNALDSVRHKLRAYMHT